MAEDDEFICEPCRDTGIFIRGLDVSGCPACRTFTNKQAAQYVVDMRNMLADVLRGRGQQSMQYGDLTIYMDMRQPPHEANMPGCAG